MANLALRILPLFAVIVGFAMALGAYMNFSGVRGGYLELINSRMQMVADDVGAVVESAVSVGIAPAEQVTLPALLSRQADADPLILSVDVLSPDGRILFSSADDRGVGDHIVSDPDGAFVLERSVLNDFGANVARVHLRFDRSEPATQITRFGAAVLADAVPAGLVAALVGALVAFFVLGQLHRRAARVSVRDNDDGINAAQREIDALADDKEGARS